MAGFERFVYSGVFVDRIIMLVQISTAGGETSKRNCGIEKSKRSKTD